MVGSEDFMKAVVGKVLGGGMRQAGIVAAGGLALKYNRERLVEDHLKAEKPSRRSLKSSERIVLLWQLTWFVIYQALIY